VAKIVAESLGSCLISSRPQAMTHVCHHVASPIGGHGRFCRNSSSTTAVAIREPRRASACRASAARRKLATRGFAGQQAAQRLLQRKAAFSHWGVRLSGQRGGAILLNDSSTERRGLICMSMNIAGSLAQDWGPMPAAKRARIMALLTVSESVADIQTSSTFFDGRLSDNLVASNATHRQLVRQT
jgi:hypothetical protein